MDEFEQDRKNYLASSAVNLSLDFDFVALRKENAPEKELEPELPVTKFEKITRFAGEVQMAVPPPLLPSQPTSWKPFPEIWRNF